MDELIATCPPNSNIKYLKSRTSKDRSNYIQSSLCFTCFIRNKTRKIVEYCKIDSKPKNNVMISITETCTDHTFKNLTNCSEIKKPNLNNYCGYNFSLIWTFENFVLDQMINCSKGPKQSNTKTHDEVSTYIIFLLIMGILKSCNSITFNLQTKPIIMVFAIGGCGSVCRAIAFDNRGLQFESSNKQP